MRIITCEYSAENLCWESDKTILTGNTKLHIVLKNAGKVIVKKYADKKPKLLISPENTEFEIILNGRSKGYAIQVVTSEEPSIIELFNI